MKQRAPLPEQTRKHNRYHLLIEPTERLFSLYPELPAAIKSRLPGWLRQISRRRPNLSISLLFAILSAFAKSIIADQGLTPTKALRDRLRLAVRIACKDPDQTTIEHLMAVLSGPADQYATELPNVLQQAQIRFMGRMAAAVNASELSEAVRQFVSYLSEITGYRTVPVRFDAKPDDVKTLNPQTAARSSIQAYTDGSTIHLPACLASTNMPDLNQAFLACYLTAHEYLHLAAGSYRFSFKSPRGRRLFRLLRRWRDNLKRRSPADGISYDLRSKLEREGFSTSAIDIKAVPDIARLFMHFPNQNLAQWLFNALEDGRLESLIARRWPGLSRIHRAHEAIYAVEVCPSPFASAAAENLINAVGMFAADRTVRARISRSHHSCFEAAKREIEKLRELPRRSVYDSALTTRRLYLLLEKHFGEQLESEDFKRIFRPDVDMEELAVRLLLVEREDEPDLYDNHGSASSDDSYKVKEPGIWLPEWNGKELQERRVHVKVQPFEPSKQYPLLPPLAFPFPSLDLKRSRRTGGAQRRWNADGPFLATERFAEYRAQCRAGMSDMQLNYNLQQTQAPLKVTLLIDLSISMEAPRHCLDGDTAIARAIQAGMWLATNLEAQRIEVEAYGGIDGGPKLCQLRELPKPVSRYIPSLRCMGAGGFRLGAFIRAISQAPPELGMKPFQGRHVLFVLTDGDGGYLPTSKEGIVADLHKNHCPGCTSRHRCRVEHARGGIDARPSAFGSPFQSRGYELADTCNSMSGAAVDAYLAVFNDQINKNQLDSSLGPNKWFATIDGSIASPFMTPDF